MNKNKFNFYAYNKFRNAKPNKFSEPKSLEEYAKIKDPNKLIELGRENMIRANYFDAFWCFEMALCRRPNSFEAHLGEYKAWLWYCISISKDPFFSIADDLYKILRRYTPREYLDEVEEMYIDDDILAADTPEGRGYYE